MNLLSVDTSTKNLSMAVSRDQEVLRFRNTRLNRPLDLSLMPSIKKILKDADIALGQLDGFAIGLGPGSFTSLRVGLSTVKGLAFATGKPIIGVPSLDIIAMDVGEENVRICVLCDAKRNLVYACLYEKEGSVLKRTSEYLLTDIHNMLKRLSGKVVFTGDGIGLFKDEIKKVKRITPKFIKKKEMGPQARWMPTLILQRAQKGKWDNVDKLIPLYLYPDHCQIK